jgi:putative transposase
VKKLRDAEMMLDAGKTVAEVVQVLGVSEQTYYRWKSKYGGMKVEEAKRLKELEIENARLKKLLADAELDKAMWKELVSPSRKREASADRVCCK